MIALHSDLSPQRSVSHQLQGEIVGLVCAGYPRADQADGIEELQAHLGWGCREVALWQATQADLNRTLCDRFMEFELGLPADETTLALRLEALSEWLSGFLSAFGWIDPTRPLSRESEEILKDLAEIRCVETPIEPDPQHEFAYTELVEYVRAAVQFLYDDRHTPIPPTTRGVVT